MGGGPPVRGLGEASDLLVEGPDGIVADFSTEPRLQELADQRVIAQLRPRPARASAQEREPLRGGHEPGDIRGIATRHDAGQVRRDDLQDRGLHQELLQVVGEVADDFLGEVVVQLLIGAGQAPDEPADLRRTSVTKGCLDQLE